MKRTHKRRCRAVSHLLLLLLLLLILHSKPSQQQTGLALPVMETKQKLSFPAVLFTNFELSWPCFFFQIVVDDKRPPRQHPTQYKKKDPQTGSKKMLDQPDLVVSDVIW
ncbi:unnamed protein product [Lota lota]